MKITEIHMFKAILSAVVFFVSACSYAANEFDGEWTAKMQTYSGSCKRLYKFNFSITNGDISGEIQGNLGSYFLVGTVTEEGPVELKLNGPDPTKLNGSFTKTKAKGKWKSSSCRGAFNFKRKNS